MRRTDLHRAPASRRHPGVRRFFTAASLIILAACSAKHGEPPPPSASAAASAPASSSGTMATRAPADASCAADPNVTIFASPDHVWTGAPLRILAVADKPIEAELVVAGPDGAAAGSSRDRHGTTPSWW